MKTDSTLIEQIKIDLQMVLKKKRYQHTLGVVKSALHLAQCYGADKDQAELAALLHDYCKNMSVEQYQEYIQRYHISFDEIAKDNPELMHGRIARYIAFDQYGIREADVLNAIEFHTTGRKQMSLLEMIVALADYIEEGRDFPGVEEIRKLAQEDIRKALLKGIDGTLKQLIDSGSMIHRDTIEARNDLIRQIKIQAEV